MKKITYPMFCYFILFILSFSGETVWAMNSTPNQDRWRVRKESPVQHYQKDFCEALEPEKNTDTKNSIKKIEPHLINHRW